MSNKESNKDWFWIGWIWSGIAFFICLLIQTHFFSNEFEKNGRKKLCELKQYEYCDKEELKELLKK